MTNEQILTDYMQKHYTDESLAALLAHAEDGKLSVYSCCCFIGAATANHALRDAVDASPGDLYAAVRAIANEPHYMEARGELHVETEGYRAELAFLQFAGTDADRRTKLIPLIKTEMGRRESLRAESPELAEVTV